MKAHAYARQPLSKSLRAEWTTRATASSVLRLALYANCNGSEKLEEKGLMMSKATRSASLSSAEEQAIGRKDLGPASHFKSLY